MDQLDKIRILGFQGGNAICLLMVNIILSYFFESVRSKCGLLFVKNRLKYILHFNALLTIYQQGFINNFQ